MLMLVLMMMMIMMMMMMMMSDNDYFDGIHLGEGLVQFCCVVLHRLVQLKHFSIFFLIFFI